jgi:Protein of unknown function (DUF2703).
MSKGKTVIKVLYWKECPSWGLALERVNKIAEEIKSKGEKDVEVVLEEIKTDEEASAKKFPGSPTILVNGKDIDEEGAKQNPIGLTCRVYYINGKYLPIPPYEFIKERILKIIEEQTYKL